MLTAIPEVGYKFAGWYLNNNLVSTDTSYRFNVLSNVTYTAKFEVSTDNNSTDNTTNNSNINQTNSTAINFAPQVYDSNSILTSPYVYNATFNNTPVGLILGRDTTESNQQTNDTGLANAVIYAEDKTLNAGNSFVFMEGVSAKDDGGVGKDLTKKVTLSGIINTKVPGKYIMHYKVKGKNGNVVSKDVTITVK